MAYLRWIPREVNGLPLMPRRPSRRRSLEGPGRGGYSSSSSRDLFGFLTVPDTVFFFPFCRPSYHFYWLFPSVFCVLACWRWHGGRDGVGGSADCQAHCSSTRQPLPAQRPAVPHSTLSRRGGRGQQKGGAGQRTAAAAHTRTRTQAAAAAAALSHRITGTHNSLASPVLRHCLLTAEWRTGACCLPPSSPSLPSLCHSR